MSERVEQVPAFDEKPYIVETPEDEYVTLHVKKKLFNLDLPSDPRGHRVKGQWAGMIVKDVRGLERDDRKSRTVTVEVDEVTVD